MTRLSDGRVDATRSAVAECRTTVRPISAAVIKCLQGWVVLKPVAADVPVTVLSRTPAVKTRLFPSSIPEEWLFAVVVTAMTPLLRNVAKGK